MGRSAPVLPPLDDRSGVGRPTDGALGFWKVLGEVFPDAREQRCWFHVGSNVLAALSKSAHPGAKADLAEIYNAEAGLTPWRRSKRSTLTMARQVREGRAHRTTRRIRR